MALLISSFLAGVLTVAAPCVLPLLPVIIGGSVVQGAAAKQSSDWRSPLIICASLVVSVVVFTLLLKSTTALLGVPQLVWSVISGLIVIVLGVTFAFPATWDRLLAPLNLSGRSGGWLQKAKQRRGPGGDILLGAALGPVFNSCSPTYALIVATILPASFAQGLAYLLAYAIGLAGALLVVTFAGQKLIRRLGWLADPHSRFRRAVGVVFIAVGVAIILQIDRSLQAFILEQGWYDPIANFEQRLGL